MYGGDTSIDSQVRAEVVGDDTHIGLALSGVWGAGSGISGPQGETPRERAEVWFDKIQV